MTLFASQKLFSFMKSYLLIAFLGGACANHVMSRRYLPCQRAQGHCPHSLQSTSIYLIATKSCVELYIAVYVDLFLFFLHKAPNVTSTTCWKCFFQCVFLAFYKKKKNQVSMVFEFIFGSLTKFHWQICRCLCKYLAVFITRALQYDLNQW